MKGSLSIVRYWLLLWFLCVVFPTTLAADNKLCPPPGQTPNLAGLAGQFVFLRQKNKGDNASCPDDDYDTTKVSATCRQAQRDLYHQNPALQAAADAYVAAVQGLVAAAFDPHDNANVNVAQVAAGAHAAFVAACQKTDKALVHHVEQNLSCGELDYHFQLRRDVACVAVECQEAERNVDNIQVLQLLVSQTESKLGAGDGQCGGGFADYTGYTWKDYLPLLTWVVLTGGCLLLAQKQKTLYAYSVVSTK